MKLHSISLQNFRCFESREFELAKRFNLFVGDNATGKTAILDALAIAAGSWFLGFSGVVSKAFGRDEVRVQSYLHGQSAILEEQYPVVVECEGTVAERSLRWQRELKAERSRTTRRSANEISTLASSMNHQVKAGEMITLPVVSYYATGRLWMQKRRPGGGREPTSSIKPGTRLRGYRAALDAASEEKHNLAWFKHNEIVALQQNETIGVLEAVRTAMQSCIEGAQRVYFDLRRDQLMVRFADSEMPLRLLSDGYHSIAMMIADIAIRAATLNPHLLNEASLRTPGVVLVDELDMHLHPKWQQRVVAELLEAFPAMQFFATTHSPFVIQALPPIEGIRLHNLDRPCAADYGDKSIEDIAEDIQDVEQPQRSLRYRRMLATAERYFALLNKAKSASSSEMQEIKNELDELSMLFSDDPAYQAFLKMERESAKID